MSIILSAGTALPGHRISQADIHRFMDSVFEGDDNERKKLKLLYERSGISSRHSVFPDFNPSLNTREFFPFTKNLEPFPSLEQRMAFYRKYAAPLAEEAVSRAFEDTQLRTKDITHLITVSCTGMSAPGLDLELMQSMELPRSTSRTSVNFMGCYAAVHALKIADSICRSDKDAIVLIVSVELCTIHFQKKQDMDNLTANAIFGDGAAACIVTGEHHHTDRSLSLTGFYSEVHTEGWQDMAWQLSSSGFLMTLSSYIPKLIGTNIRALLANALAKSRLDPADIDAWAIHPGGRKILEAAEQELHLEPGKLKHSYDVLRDSGNMSSATILFVLDRMMKDEQVSGKIFGAAFGPGLTMETFLAEKAPAPEEETTAAARPNIHSA